MKEVENIAKSLGVKELLRFDIMYVDFNYSIL